MAVQEDITQTSNSFSNRTQKKPAVLKSVYRPSYWTTWLGVTILTLIGRLPRKVSLRFGSFLGDLFYYTNKKRRQIAQSNLELCFPHWPIEKRQQTLREHFRGYGQVVVDFGMLWLAREKRLNEFVHISGLENWNHARSSNRPVIFLTPHMIATDLTGTVLARHFPTCTMMHELKNPLLNQLVAGGRSRFGLKVFTRSQGIRSLIRSLKDQTACIYIPDEDFGVRSSVLVPFLGTVSSTLTTLGRLARITNAVVLPFHSRLDTKTGHYFAEIGAPLENYPTSDSYKDARRMNAVFEDIILSAPDQYMWTLRWFKTRPENAPNPY